MEIIEDQTKDAIIERMFHLRGLYHMGETSDEERVVLADEYHKLYVMLPRQEAQGMGPIIGDVLPFRPSPTEAEMKANLERLKVEEKAAKQQATPGNV